MLRLTLKLYLFAQLLALPSTKLTIYALFPLKLDIDLTMVLVGKGNIRMEI